jgi:hypothetical protein
MKRRSDGEPPHTPLEDWALRHRFTQPGTHDPLRSYIYAEQAPLMKLSPDEARFLQHWMYDEVHYQEGADPAKRLQLQNRVISADLAALIAAAVPDLADQEAAGLGPPPLEPPTWPWSEEGLVARVREARAALAGRIRVELSGSEGKLDEALQRTGFQRR